MEFTKAWSRPYTFRCGKDNLAVLQKWPCVERSGIYLFSDAQDTSLLYVGKAEDLSVRLCEHLSGGSSANQYIRNDVRNGESLTIRWAYSREPYLSESLAIALLTPPYNGKCEWSRGIDSFSIRACEKESSRLGLLDVQSEDGIFINLLEGFGISIRKARSQKEDLCRQSEQLGRTSSSTNWKSGAQEARRLQAKFRKIGYTGDSFDADVYARFKSNIDRFYDHRSLFFKQKNREIEESRKKKEKICSQAEYICNSSDWKQVAIQYKELQSEWKRAGFSGKETESSLWSRFRSAQDKFYNRRKEHYSRIDDERKKNLRAKQELVVEIERLASFQVGDVREAIQTVKSSKIKWKQIGPVPRQDNDEIWNRYKNACDRIYEWSNIERERQRHQWRQKMEDVIERKQEKINRLEGSIIHDREVIQRKQEKIYQVRPGRREHEIKSGLESQIESIRSKISSKEASIFQLRDSIQDIRTKLRNSH